MPNPHFDVQIISRGNGSSAVGSAAYRSGTKMTARRGGRSTIAAAAYRSGDRLYDELEQKTYDYTRKEDVLHKEIMLPENAPDWVKALTREQLWNKVEATEKRKDAQLARDVIASLPRELNLEEQILLVQEFVKTNFTGKGMITDIAIHDKQASDALNQPHVHIMLTMRDLDSHGFGGKNRAWNDRKLVTEWRNSWETFTNDALEKAGRSERVSLKSNKERGINRLPQEYMGYEASALERKGIKTEKGERNRRIRHQNRVQDSIEGLYPERAGTRKAEADPARPRSLADVAKELQSGESGEPRSKASDDRTAWQRFEQNTRNILRATGNAVHLRARQAMWHSLRERNRLQERAAFTRYTLLQSSRDLSKELEEGRGYER